MKVTIKVAPFDVSRISKNFLLSGGVEQDSKVAIDSLNCLLNQMKESIALSPKFKDQKDLNDQKFNEVYNLSAPKLEECKKIWGNELNQESRKDLSNLYKNVRDIFTLYVKGTSALKIYSRKRLSGIKLLVKPLGECSKYILDECKMGRNLDKTSKFSAVPFDIPKITEQSFLNPENSGDIRELLNAIIVCNMREQLPTVNAKGAIVGKHAFSEFSDNMGEILGKLLDLDEMSSIEKRIKIIKSIIKECNIYIEARHRPIYSSKRIAGVKKIKQCALKALGEGTKYGAIIFNIPKELDKLKNPQKFKRDDETEEIISFVDIQILKELKVGIMTCDKASEKIKSISSRNHFSAFAKQTVTQIKNLERIDTEIKKAVTQDKENLFLAQNKGKFFLAQKDCFMNIVSACDKYLNVGILKRNIIHSRDRKNKIKKIKGSAQDMMNFLEDEIKKSGII